MRRNQGSWLASSNLRLFSVVIMAVAFFALIGAFEAVGLPLKTLVIGQVNIGHMIGLLCILSAWGLYKNKF